MVASIRNISARGVTIGTMVVPPPPPPPSYTTLLHAQPDVDMVYTSVYTAWINSVTPPDPPAVAEGTGVYWIASPPEYAAPGATYTNVINVNQYKEVEFSITNKTSITPQAGGFSNTSMVGEYVIGSTLTSRIVVGLQMITGSPDSSVSIYSQPLMTGALMLYDSTGSFTLSGWDFGNGTTVTTGFAPGDIVGVVFDIANMSGYRAGFFKNGVLVGSKAPDSFFKSVGFNSFSHVTGPVSP